MTSQLAPDEPGAVERGGHPQVHGRELGAARSADPPGRLRPDLAQPLRTRRGRIRGCSETAS